MKMAEESSYRLKTLWEKEKLFVTSNISFSRCVFERLVLRTFKTRACLGKGYTLSAAIIQGREMLQKSTLQYLSYLPCQMLSNSLTDKKQSIYM